MQGQIAELKETTGNRDANTGGSAPGVTAASAIAAMQEQSGKTSRASTLSAYRAYGKIIDMHIELIRQFYDLPRQFRIVGESGMDEYVSYSNNGIKPTPQELAGADMGLRVPAFDVDVQAQKMNVYTKVTQNELALQLYQLGILDPANSDKALALLDIMDFAHKDVIEDKVRKNGTMYQLLAQYQQIALTLAAQSEDAQLVEMIAANIQQTQGDLGGQPVQGMKPVRLTGNVDPTRGIKAENPVADRAKAKAQATTQPQA